MEIGLVSCTKAKQDSAATPRELYEPSALFRKSRDYAEENHEEWYILSPKHYVLDPDGPPIEPYDETLTDTGIDERRDWSHRVLGQLEDRGVLSEGNTVVIHAGQAYYGELLPLLEDEHESTLTSIARAYPWASWAIWDPSFPDGDCVEQRPQELLSFVQERADQLTPDIVFLGLNRSADLPAPIANFHSPSRTHYDYRLKETIQDGGLERLHGGYLTDLVDEIDPDSHCVTVTDGDAELLLEQLHRLGEQEFHIICFGNKPFDGLVSYFDATVSEGAPELKRATVETDGLVLHLYRVWFYGLYGANRGKVEVFKRQLEALNNRTE